MNFSHHPDEATLMSFAAGSLPGALSAVIALHLTACERCRRHVRRLEAIGAALFSDMPQTPLAAFERQARRRPAMDLAGRFKGELNAETKLDPVARLIGMRLDEVRWKHLGYGVWHFPLAHLDYGEGDLRLLKVDPGQAIPEHGHGGSELTLVLRGAYRDHMGFFRTGDVADLDDQVAHRPLADPDIGCICLVASEQKVHFTGTVGKMLHEIAGI